MEPLLLPQQLLWCCSWSCVTVLSYCLCHSSVCLYFPYAPYDAQHSPTPLRERKSIYAPLFWLFPVSEVQRFLIHHFIINHELLIKTCSKLSYSHHYILKILLMPSTRSSSINLTFNPKLLKYHGGSCVASFYPIWTQILDYIVHLLTDLPPSW